MCDLNYGSVKAGTFPGSFVIPGTKQVSLAIGGFVKTVAIEDSNVEALGADMLPSTLGTQRPDTEGNFSIDSTLTRLFLDARAPAGNGSLRGYIEYNLNATNNGNLGFKLRQAYGSWKSRAGTLLAGHTWSTLMDLKIIPEGLTEPTVSGAIFVRQAQLRWTQGLGESAKADFAFEDPTGADVFGNPSLQPLSPFPDFIASLEYNKSGVGHVRLGGACVVWSFLREEMAPVRLQQDGG